jgi:hypothetical protein
VATAIAARSDMVQGARKLETKGSGHPSKATG